MPNTPSQRTTRSSSNPSNSNFLSEVKLWIESSEAKIVSTLRDDLTKISGLLESLSKRVEDVELKNAALESRCATLEKNNSFLSAELSKLRSFSTSLGSEILEESVRESQNRIRRLQNVVVQGVPEAPTGSLEERKCRDLEQFEGVLREMEISDYVISDVRRVGRKRSDGSRLMLVRMGNVDCKMRILNKSKCLKNSQSMNRVFIKPDLTPMQQAQDKRIRDELKRRRTNGEDVTIFRGRVMERSELQNFQ